MKKLCAIILTISLVSSSACNPHKTIASEDVAQELNTRAIDGTQNPSRLSGGIESVQLIDQNHLFLSDGKLVYKTQDGGRTWKQIYEVTSGLTQVGHIKGMCFINSEIGFLVVDEYLLRTENSGENWSVVGNIKLGEREFFISSCYFVDSSTGWLVGGIWSNDQWVRKADIAAYVGAVLATKDGGRTWEQQQVILPEGYFQRGRRWLLRDVFFKNSETGWVVGNGVIFWTKDGGNSWNLAKAKDSDYCNVDFYDDELGWATQREGNDYAITKDGGRNWIWTRGPKKFGAISTRLSFLTPTKGIAALLGLYITTDGGRTWNKIEQSNIRGDMVYEFLGRGKDGTIVGLYFQNGELKVINSNDGIYWQRVE
jgi:photosystem II stability/assembly factor-like uncharacterized protein